MKIIKLLLKIIYFFPPVAVSVLFVLMQGKGVEFIHIILFALLWMGSLLLAFNKIIGAVVGASPMVYLLIYELLNPSWLDFTIYLIMGIGYYFACGALVYFIKKKEVMK